MTYHGSGVQTTQACWRCFGSGEVGQRMTREEVLAEFQATGGTRTVRFPPNDG